MTKEQVIIEYIQNYLDSDMYQYEACYLNKEDLELIIEALEMKNVLSRIRTEIDRKEVWLLQAGYTAYNINIAFDSIKHVIAESEAKS